MDPKVCIRSDDFNHLVTRRRTHHNKLRYERQRNECATSKSGPIRCHRPTEAGREALPAKPKRREDDERGGDTGHLLDERRNTRVASGRASRRACQSMVASWTEVEPATRISFRVLIRLRVRSRATSCSPAVRSILSRTSPSLWYSPSLPWCEHLPSCTSADFVARDTDSAGASGYR